MEALHSGHIGGAGLDAHHEEPADPSEPLYQHPNVIATPHTGVSTLDVVEMYSEVLRDNIVRRRRGQRAAAPPAVDLLAMLLIARSIRCFSSGSCSHCQSVIVLAISTAAVYMCRTK